MLRLYCGGGGGGSGGAMSAWQLRNAGMQSYENARQVRRAFMKAPALNPSLPSPLKTPSALSQ
jgi:hypothetical protein